MKIWSLSRRAFGRYKLQIVIVAVLGFISGMLEGVGINAIIPLFSFVVNNQSQGEDAISEIIRKMFLFFDVNFSLKYILIFISLLFILKAIVLVLSNYIAAKIATDYEESMRNRLLGAAIKATWPHLLKQKLGYLENILMVDVERGSILLLLISNTIMTIAGLLVYILVAINISFYITLITLFIGGILFFTFKPFIYKTRETANQITDLNKQIAHQINESALGMKTIKTGVVGDKIIKIGREFFSRLKKLKIRVYLLKNVTSSFLQPISLIFICVVFAFSYKIPGFQFAALLAVIYLIQKIFQYIQQLQINLHGMNEAAPYLKNVLNCEENALISGEKNHGQSDFCFNKSLEFKNARFAYTAEKEILSDVSFEIRKGEMIGLVGPSGAGKTTIVDLILRLFEPSGGQILVDKNNITEINLKKWREHIGYVSQDIFLINDTILNNIKFYNESIIYEDAVEAAKMANIYDFIQTCPNGFDTLIGERGIMLSTGQRQRIVIARELVRKPEILILDEATSALDNESEVEIQKAIEQLKGKMTIIVIAHRLSTIMDCNRLIVLEGGRIIEQGAPSELLKDDKTYFYKVYNIRN